MSVRSSEASFDRAGLPELSLTESDGLSILVSLMFEMKKKIYARTVAAAELAFERKQKKILGTAQASWAKIQALLGLGLD